MCRLSDEIDRLEETKVLEGSNGYNGRERMISSEDGEKSRVQAVVGLEKRGH